MWQLTERSKQLIRSNCYETSYKYPGDYRRDIYVEAPSLRRRDFLPTKAGEGRPFHHNVSADTDRCFDVIKATNSEVPAGSTLALSVRAFPIARRSALLMDRYRCVLPREATGASRRSPAPAHNTSERAVELFTSLVTGIHNCRINADDPINAILFNTRHNHGSSEPVLLSAAPSSRLNEPLSIYAG